MCGQGVSVRFLFVRCYCAPRAFGRRVGVWGARHANHKGKRRKQGRAVPPTGGVARLGSPLELSPSHIWRNRTTPNRRRAVSILIRALKAREGGAKGGARGGKRRGATKVARGWAHNARKGRRVERLCSHLAAEWCTGRR